VNEERAREEQRLGLAGKKGRVVDVESDEAAGGEVPAPKVTEKRLKTPRKGKDKGEEKQRKLIR
jgi:hypothetical protein